MKKDQNLPNKNMHSNNSSGKPLQITIITIDSNHLTEITIAEVLQIKIFHKTETADQIVKIPSIEIFTQDQTHKEVIPKQ